MNWKPTPRKLAFTLGLAVLCVVLEWFLSAPLRDPMSLGRSIVMGLVAGYLISPWLASVRYPPGYFRPTVPRLVKTLVIAGLGVLILIALQVVTHRLDFSAAGFLVTLLFIAGGVYIKLGNTLHLTVESTPTWWRHGRGARFHAMRRYPCSSCRE